MFPRMGFKMLRWSKYSFVLLKNLTLLVLTFPFQKGQGFHDFYPRQYLTDEVVVSNKRSFEALKRFFTNFSRGFCDSNILRKTLVNLLTLAPCTLGPARTCCLAIPFQFNSLHILLVLVGPGSLDPGPIPISPLISHNLQALSSLQ